MAERVGFEPTMVLPIPAFQASALSQTMRPLRAIYSTGAHYSNIISTLVWSFFEKGAPSNRNGYNNHRKSTGTNHV
jgi:hypothetical protein